MPYTACFDKIEALKKEAVSTQAASKLADTSRAIGSFIGKIPVVKEGPVDECGLRNPADKVHKEQPQNRPIPRLFLAFK